MNQIKKIDSISFYTPFMVEEGANNINFQTLYMGQNYGGKDIQLKEGPSTWLDIKNKVEEVFTLENGERDWNLSDENVLTGDDYEAYIGLSLTTLPTEYLGWPSGSSSPGFGDPAPYASKGTLKFDRILKEVLYGGIRDVENSSTGPDNRYVVNNMRGQVEISVMDQPRHAVWDYDNNTYAFRYNSLQHLWEAYSEFGYIDMKMKSGPHALTTKAHITNLSYLSNFNNMFTDMPSSSGERYNISFEVEPNSFQWS